MVRYADDCNVYVRSQRAGERVMAALERMYRKLRLRVNREKSKVELAHKCSLLSYSFWYSKGGTVMRRVAPKATAALKQRVRQITRRSGGRSLRAVVAELRKYLPELSGISCLSQWLMSEAVASSDRSVSEILCSSHTMTPAEGGRKRYGGEQRKWHRG